MARIVAVADQLAPVRDRLVFIGGTVLPLLVDVDGRYYAPRMTEDVDAVGVAVNYADSARVEAAVASAGFRRDMTARHKGRWIGPSGSIFDLSFAGQFAGASGAAVDSLAIDTAMAMDGYANIRHVSPTGLFLMKCAAYQDRGLSRPEDSKDLADIAVLLVGADISADVQRRTERVQDEVQKRARWLAGLPTTEVALIGHFADRHPRPPDTAEDLATEAMDVLVRLAS